MMQAKNTTPKRTKQRIQVTTTKLYKRWFNYYNFFGIMYTIDISMRKYDEK